MKTETYKKKKQTKNSFKHECKYLLSFYLFKFNNFFCQNFSEPYLNNF